MKILNYVIGQSESVNFVLRDPVTKTPVNLTGYTITFNGTNDATGAPVSGTIPASTTTTAAYNLSTIVPITTPAKFTGRWTLVKAAVTTKSKKFGINIEA